MRELTIIFASLILLSISSQAQSRSANNWLSFVIQAEARPGGNTSWQRVQRLEVSKRAGMVLTGQENTAGVIRLDPNDKEVRFTFSNFTINGAWFSPSEIAVEYQEDGRSIGPIRALPGAANSEYFQMTLRFREKTDRSVLSVRVAGRTSGQFVKDTINTLLVWGVGDTQPADVQVSYLDNQSLAARTPYAGEVPSYGATQGRIQSEGGLYAIQLGAYTILPDSRQFSAAAAFGKVYSRRIGSLNYVRVGPYADSGLAQQYLQQIRSSFPEAYLVVEDNTPQAAAAPAVNAYSNESAFAPPASYGNVAGPRLPSPGDLTAKGTYILPSGTTGYAIQLASYGKEESAVSFIGRLRQRGFSDVYVWKKDGNNRVVVGTFADKISAANYLETIKRQYSQDGIVVYIDGR